MGDKSPKSKDKNQKQQAAGKNQKQQAADKKQADAASANAKKPK